MCVVEYCARFVRVDDPHPHTHTCVLRTCICRTWLSELSMELLGIQFKPYVVHTTENSSLFSDCSKSLACTNCIVCLRVLKIKSPNIRIRCILLLARKYFFFWFKCGRHTAHTQTPAHIRSFSDFFFRSVHEANIRWDACFHTYNSHVCVCVCVHTAIRLVLLLGAACCCCCCHCSVACLWLRSFCGWIFILSVAGENSTSAHVFYLIYIL